MCNYAVFSILNKLHSKDKSEKIADRNPVFLTVAICIHLSPLTPSIYIFCKDACERNNG